MRRGIELRQDYDAARLRALAKATRNAGQSRRLLAPAEIYDGGTRSKAARVGGVGLQTVRDWVVRFNAHGPEGLIVSKASRWWVLSLQIFPGALLSVRPSGPWALKRTTQSRTVCSPTPPTRAALVRVPLS